MKCNHVLSKVSEGKTETLKVCAKCNKILKRIPKSTLKPESVAVVLTDFETTQLQALDANVREVEPFILRSVKK